MPFNNTALSLQEKNGSISCELQAEYHEIEADRLHLTNVLYNLIDNAIKYCKDSPRIMISTGNSNKHIYLDVKDNGMGIARENHKRVFQKFYRVPTGNVHDVKGFGLGLNYVKSIITAHRGNIELESELGMGSIFKIFLPVEPQMNILRAT